MIKVAVSGGFDPFCHVGHLDHFREASKLGDWLMVILTRDGQLSKKKLYSHTPYEERRELVEIVLRGLGINGEVVQNIDRDITCNESLEYYRPDKFAKGGDRTPDHMPEAEIIVCQKIGCEIVYGVQGRVRSSSQRIKRVVGILGARR
jgi:cytidyltransferase-like protein